jgi:FAD/FMN-containing dehydrogenase/Fe-S oxidoreductase
VEEALLQLKKNLDGELEWDELHKKLYATDASVYKMSPLAVAFPKNKKDLRQLIAFALEHNTSLIPRTAGTSLAGQCVGPGIVVDVSKYFTAILDFDFKQKTVTVQPGVNRDALNVFLAEKGLFFGPNTSTSQYCLLGGMLGNNSSGTTSIRYGVTRDVVIAVETLLSDGSEATFKACDSKELETKLNNNTQEGKIYHFLFEALSDPKVQNAITTDFPDASVHRRNTGYAVDVLLNQRPFNSQGEAFNIAKLLAGSEGTLAFTTAMTFSLVPIPPKHSVMLALHFKSIQEAMLAVNPVMEHHLYTCELMDKTILDCTRNHSGYQKNRFFLKGDPKAILLLELRNHNLSTLKKELSALEKKVSDSNLSYAAVPLWGEEIELANELRHAGLGLLGNIVGDSKAVACIEDTAVPLKDLALYIDEFQELMKQFGQEVVYYAHAGAGELHLRPILNLKTPGGVNDFKALTLAVAHLVKKYKGSLSGEHGDGIVRSEFIPIVVGQENYALFKRIKKVFDPDSIFNPGKIVDSFAMDQNLRTNQNEIPIHPTLFDFSSDQGLLRAAEKCNGAGKCRSVAPSGTMCPSYRATRDEKHNTRGRANVLREVLTQNKTPNAFDSQELKEVFDLCLSCKACATECPSSVDIATYKAEFLHQYSKSHGRSIRDKLFAFVGKINKVAQPIRGFQNFLFANPLTSFVLKKSLGIAEKRALPKLDKPLDKSLINNKLNHSTKSVYLYLDEFSNYNETQIGKDAFALLEGLGYHVKFLASTESGRSYISKGFLDEAKACADRNVALYHGIISEHTPLLGIEPSAIYTFIDEYPKLSSYPEKAKELAEFCRPIETFLAEELIKGNLKEDQFNSDVKEIKIHAHCYQKALGKPSDTFSILNLPKNHSVALLNTGCCGMAGSFGYEKEHYEVSMKVGEERLFPSLRKIPEEVIIAANGTSCRHQIKDGVQRKSQHPISILKAALVKKNPS